MICGSGMSDGQIMRSDSEAFGGYWALGDGMSREIERARMRMRFEKCGSKETLDLLVKYSDIDGTTRLTFVVAPHGVGQYFTF